jgi:hydroxypyruvate isomerase
MPRFSANISTMFTEREFFARIGAASEAGFKAVEFLFPYDEGAMAIRRTLDGVGMTPALHNAPPGDLKAGERGLASLPGREADFAASLETAFRYTETIRPKNLHVMAGIGGDRATYIANLKHAAATAPAGLTVLIEPINSRDMPGYHLNTTTDALTVLDAVGADNLRLQLDLYHCQIMEGDLATRIRALLPYIQMAGVPERHEPNVGEVNYPYLFDLLDDLGYDGFVGCEYHPQTVTEDGLGWFQPWRERQ